MQVSTASESERAGSGEPNGARAGEALPIRAVGLSKRYVHPWTRRAIRGLESLDLEVRPGEVLGLLGPNGAGKTTTLKLLMGLLRPSGGNAWIFGRPIEDVESRRDVGFLPEQPYFYDYLNGLEYLELAARLSGIPGHEASERARRWLGRVGLGERPKLVLRKYSKGMLQRLGLAAALVHEPQLLVLDEPMSGLDPFGRRDVRELIHDQRARGTTVLFSSHILPDVEMLCDRVAILMNGRQVRVAPVGDLVRGGRHAVEIRCAPGAVVTFAPEWGEGLQRIERAGETVFTLADEGRLPVVLAGLLQAGVAVRAVTPQRPSLEALFLETAYEDGAREPGDDARRSA